MAIMPKMQLALNDCSVYGSVARRIGNKMTYDVTRQTIRLALCLGLDSVKVGTNDLHNEFLLMGWKWLVWVSISGSRSRKPGLCFIDRHFRR